MKINFKQLKTGFMFIHDNQVWVKTKEYQVSKVNAVAFAFKPGLEITGKDDGIWRQWDAGARKRFSPIDLITPVELDFRELTETDLQKGYIDK